MKPSDLVKDSKGKLYKIKSIIRKRGCTPVLEFTNTKGEYPIEDYKLFVPEYTPENIESLNSNEIFVFGSNTEGRHGAGAAKTASSKFGAKYGQNEGLQGQSYAIITVDLSMVEKYPLEKIYEGILRFLKFATDFRQYKFYVTKIGSSLAGYSIEDIAEQFKRASVSIDIPNNVILPKEYECRYKID